MRNMANETLRLSESQFSAENRITVIIDKEYDESTACARLVVAFVVVDIDGCRWLLGFGGGCEKPIPDPLRESEKR